MVPDTSDTDRGSMEATRSMGTKILRRVGSSTTSPMTLGGLGPDRIVTTTSRMRPMSSPSGPITGSPASLATKALLRFAMRTRLVIERRQPYAEPDLRESHPR
ncbi:hypothetical protein GCM10022294_21910 [Dietzia aurantiaca]